MLLLLYFLTLYFFFRRQFSVLNFFLLLQIISLFVMIFIKNDVEIDSLRRIFNVIYISILLTVVYYQWRRFSTINMIYSYNENKIKKLTKILLIFSMINFVVLIISSIAILNSISDIHNFKYDEGVYVNYLYKRLPINVRWFLLTIYTYGISYFLIPLHFYYLRGKNYGYAFLCFFFSLNIVLYGLTFFSRWTITHYILIYSVFFLLFKNSLSRTYKRLAGIISLAILVILGYWFISISINRFEDDFSYYLKIPIDSPIQNTTLYSSLDYISQWYSNCLIVLDKYKYETLHGQASFYQLLELINSRIPINWSSIDYVNLREALLGKEYSILFIGLVGGWVYDFGYLLSLVFGILYSYIIKKIAPINGKTSISHLLLSVLLIQIPLFSIFYNFIGGIVFPIIFYIPIYYYLRPNHFKT